MGRYARRRVSTLAEGNDIAPHAQVRLPVFDSAGQLSLEETLPAEPLGGNRYRLVASPGLVEGLAAGDEIELDGSVPSGFRVLRRSGQLCIWFYLAKTVPSAADARVIRAADRLGGYLDGGRAQLRVLTIPVTAGFEAVGRELDDAVRDLPGSSWLYGNVYEGGNPERPLEWWLERH